MTAALLTIDASRRPRSAGMIPFMDEDPVPERLPGGRRVLSVRTIVVVGLALVAVASPW